MPFSSKRGRPAKNIMGLKLIEGGRQPEETQKRAIVKITREPIDICHEKGLIDSNEHWAAIHFRWLYTIKFGAPGISASDPNALSGRSAHGNDSQWQEAREREYAMAVEKLRKSGALKIVLNFAVFGYFPRFLGSAKIIGRSCFHAAELGKLREGLELLAKHWGRDSKNG